MNVVERCDGTIDVITNKINVNEVQINLHKFPELPQTDFNGTHLNSSKGKVVFGGKPGLNVTIRKKIVKLMRKDPIFLTNPIFISTTFVRDFHTKLSIEHGFVHGIALCCSPNY